MMDAALAIVGGIVRNPELLLPLLIGVGWLNRKGSKLAAAGLITRPARAGIVGFLLLAGATIGFLLFMRNPNNRRAATTAAISGGVVLALAIAWWVPSLRWQVIVPAFIALVVYAFLPGDLLWEGQGGGALWTWLEGELPTPANIRAAMARDRRERLAPMALAACTDAAHIRSQVVDEHGTIRTRIAVDPGASPAQIRQLAEDGTLTNAMNRLAEDQRAGVQIVDTRAWQDGGELVIEHDTTPRRLPEVAPWPES